MIIEQKNEKLVISLDKTEDKEIFERVYTTQPKAFFEYLFKLDKFLNGTDNDQDVLTGEEEKSFADMGDAELLTSHSSYLQSMRKRIDGIINIIPKDCFNAFILDDQYNASEDENIIHLCHECEKLDDIHIELTKRDHMRAFVSNIQHDKRYDMFQPIIRQEVSSILNELTDREANILKSLYGMESSFLRSYEEIEREFGATKEEVDAICEIARLRLLYPTHDHKKPKSNK